jgi:hypothetical protein
MKVIVSLLLGITPYVLGSRIALLRVGERLTTDPSASKVTMFDSDLQPYV